MDNLTKEQRRKNMQLIRSSETKIEKLVSHALWAENIRFRKNVRNLPGKPDIAIKKYKIVIFIDSCFWHKCPIHFKKPKSNNSYWDNKIDSNVSRDFKINDYYLSNSWNIMRIWEHELKSKENQNKTIRKIIEFVQKIKMKQD